MALEASPSNENQKKHCNYHFPISMSCAIVVDVDGQ